MGTNFAKYITDIVDPTIDGVRKVMREDTACERIVPSDLRVLIGEIDRLRKVQTDYHNVLKAALYLEPDGIDLVNRLTTYAISERSVPHQGGGE
jgi:hypothetical protein